eukprot:Hpha_TRINITY_DN10055_c0_g1::TRINITY_DN10055_c0_g1_i1::g.84037::m.84037
MVNGLQVKKPGATSPGSRSRTQTQPAAAVAATKTVEPPVLKKRRRGQQFLDYVCCTPASFLKIRRDPRDSGAEVASLSQGEAVKVKKILTISNRAWAQVIRSDHLTTGWAPLRQNMGSKTQLLRPHTPRFEVLPLVPSYAVPATREWMQREGGFGEVPEGVLEQTTPSTLIRALLRVGNAPEDPPLSLLVGTRTAKLVTIVYALTAATERGRGLMRLLVSIFLAECCRSDDEVVVLCIRKDVAVWKRLGFVHSDRDPRTTGQIPIADAGARCLRWPAGLPYPDPKILWESADGYAPGTCYADYIEGIERRRE